MRGWSKILAAAAGTATVLWAVTVNGSLAVLGTLSANHVDFTSAVATAPMKAGATLPANCTVGQAFFKTDAAAGQNLHLCTAANTWTQVQGAAGGGSMAFNWKPDPRYVLMRTEFATGYNLPQVAYLGDFAFVRAVGSQNLNMVTSGYDGRVGVTNFSTNTTAGNQTVWHASLHWPATLAQGLYGSTDREWELVYSFRYHGTSDSVNSSFWTGLMQASGGNPQLGLGVRYLAGTDSTFMFFVNGTSNVWGPLVSSGVPADANWHTLRIRSDGSQAYRMWISLDGGTERSVCPSGCDLTAATGISHVAFQALLVSIQTNEAAQKSVDYDYAYFWMNWGAR